MELLMLDLYLIVVHHYIQLTEALDLPNIRDRKWTIVESDAKLGKGLKEGFDWLAGELNPQGKE